MDVRIGIADTPKEIEVDLGDSVKEDDVQKQIEAVLAGSPAVLWLTDRRGRKVGVPAVKIAYVEIDGGKADHRVGFVG